MRAFVIDDEFFNQSAIQATPRSSCRPALEKRLDTADIVRDGCKTGLLDIGRRAPYTQLLSGRRSGSNPEGHKNISPKHLEKPQHFRMSSPKTTQPFAVQQHPRGMLVRSNLLSLKQIEKAPETPGFLFLRQENSRQALYFEYFSRNLFRLNSLRTVTPSKPMILDTLSAR
jgi:hypothetical protein